MDGARCGWFIKSRSARVGSNQIATGRFQLAGMVAVDGLETSNTMLQKMEACDKHAEYKRSSMHSHVVSRSALFQDPIRTRARLKQCFQTKNETMTARDERG
jgi:hypothetical protein